MRPFSAASVLRAEHAPPSISHGFWRWDLGLCAYGGELGALPTEVSPQPQQCIIPHHNIELENRPKSQSIVRPRCMAKPDPNLAKVYIQL